MKLLTRQQYENEQQRKTTLYATALANESEGATKGLTNTFSKISDLFASAARQMGTNETNFGT